MRRALQWTFGIASLIPLAVSIRGVLAGSEWFLPTEVVTAQIDTHYRYLAGVYATIAFLIWWTIPTIERRGPVVRIICLGIFVGGIGRALSMAQVGQPGAVMIGFTVFELCAVPLIAAWQYLV
jgi:hypothetical protein